MPSETVLIRNAAYNPDLCGTVADMLDILLDGRLFPGMKVLVKPNLLMASPPDRAICTHPLVVRAVVEYLLNREVRCRVSDAPAIGAFEKILSDTHYGAYLGDLDVTLSAFQRHAPRDIGPPFGRIDLACAPWEADLVINIAKLKTHVQMLLTLGVKNLFGCVVGLKKTQWHLRAGVDRELFARLLVQICRTVDPAVTLVDGILAMQGQGPSVSGTPRSMGVLVGGNNPFSVDAAVCRLLGVDPGRLPTHRVAKDMGLISEEIRISGPEPGVTGFRLPVLASPAFGPKAFQKFMRKHWIQRPVVDSRRCNLCGRCRRHCPAGAIDERHRRICFDYDRCIRCYCCVEICREGALETCETLIGRAIRMGSDTGVRVWSRMRGAGLRD